MRRGGCLRSPTPIQAGGSSCLAEQPGPKKCVVDQASIVPGRRDARWYGEQPDPVC